MIELLKYIHGRKQMNCRGISAKNILVESDGTLKLVNFRCKKVKDRTDTRPEEIQALGHMLL